MKYSPGDLIRISREAVIIDSIFGRKKISEIIYGIVLDGWVSSTYVMDRPVSIRDVSTYKVLCSKDVVSINEAKILGILNKGV